MSLLGPAGNSTAPAPAGTRDAPMRASIDPALIIPSASNAFDNSVILHNGDMATHNLPIDFAGSVPNPAKTSMTPAFLLRSHGCLCLGRRPVEAWKIDVHVGCGRRKLASAAQPAFLSVAVSSARLNRARKAWASAACLKQYRINGVPSAMAPNRSNVP